VGFRDGIQDFEELGLQILGVSFDSVEENRAFAEKHAFPFDLLSDADRMMGQEYGACQSAEDRVAKRISYLIDEEGVVRKVYPHVKPAEHADEVLRDLRNDSR
jgi:peroxiredoxin Q/BCP